MKTKKILSILLSVCVILAFMPQMAFAYTSGDFEYSVSGDNVTITKYNGSGGEVVIPAEIDDKTVTAIGTGAFRDKPSITSVTIPDSVTAIEESAFNGCTSLKSIGLREK